MNAVQICNLALSHIQVSTTIEDLDPKRGREEEECAKFYDVLREQSLAGFSWDFATELRPLTPVTAVAQDPRFPYAYQYPQECLRFLRVVTMVTPSATLPGTSTFGIPHVVRRDADHGRVIWTTIEEATGEWVRNITDSEEFDPTFSLALSWWLGAHIAVPLTGKQQRKDSCLRMFNALAPAARIKHSSEADDTPEQETSWLEER